MVLVQEKYVNYIGSGFFASLFFVSAFIGFWSFFFPLVCFAGAGAMKGKPTYDSPPQTLEFDI